MEKVCDSAGFVVRPPSNADDADAVALFRDGKLEEALAATYYAIPGQTESPETALELWYIRVQSMLILQYKVEATKEIGACLGILDDSKEPYAEFKRSVLTSPQARLNSWKLRLLLVPVRVGRINQAAIQKYYSMSFEARDEAGIGDLKQEWLDCIRLAGMYVVSALITLKDYSSAIDLLTLHFEATKDSQLAVWLGLLHIMVGDTLGARSWASEVPGDTPSHRELSDLIKFAEDDSRTEDTGVVADVFNGRIDRALAELTQSAPGPRYAAHTVANRMNTRAIRKIIQ